MAHTETGSTSEDEIPAPNEKKKRGRKNKVEGQQMDCEFTSSVNQVSELDNSEPLSPLNTQEVVTVTVLNNKEIDLLSELQQAQLLLSDLKQSISTYEVETEKLKRKIKQQKEEIDALKSEKNKLQDLNIELQQSMLFLYFIELFPVSCARVWFK